MLKDIGHPFGSGEKVYDVTFENVQAGLRTDYLFRLANQHGGMVVGTGDLSELGLGWCTYGVGDHMSHYNPNGSVSKTLIQHLIRFVAASGDVDKGTAKTLHDILNTEISPELIPAGASGAIQSTEQSVGPYALQDFNLFYLTRFGFRPSKIAFLAWNAWHDEAKGAWPANLPADAKRAFTLAEIKKWMTLFLRRFFTNQFKRSALPNGPKISSGGSLSPRGDWRAPSDGSPDVWLAELVARSPAMSSCGRFRSVLNCRLTAHANRQEKPMPLEIKKTVQQMVDEANAAIETLPLAEATKVHGASGITFIDIRDPRELWRDGTIPGAINVTRGMLEMWIDPKSPYAKEFFQTGNKFVFFCAGAWRSALATKTAQDMGLTPVAHFEGGFGAWKKAGGPVETVEPKK
jgi:NH3-dependent NAD+ synthetase/rhodanese-related sulfurtransferase